ncbi:MAG: hypothetical protein WDZ39_00740 [Candidatus Spechtbacterales bacterium]
MPKNPSLKKTPLVLSILFFVGVFFYGVFFIYQDNFSAEASSHNNVSGWAWSSNVGWISFSCENEGTCGTSDYGVDIDEANGNFSGYAWSNNIGWISFERSETGDPPSNDPGGGSGPIAQLDLSSGLARGWARALVGMDDPADGWDGWIRLSGQTGDDDPYGVSLDLLSEDECKFTGWAWGDEVTGWTSFSSGSINHPTSTEYAVMWDSTTAEILPQAFNLFVDVNTPDAVKEEADEPPSPQCSTEMQFFWNYYEPGCGAVDLIGYRLQVAPGPLLDAQSAFDNFDNSGDISGLQFDSGNVTSTATTRRVTVADPAFPENDNGQADGSGTLAFNSEYYWRVRTISTDEDDNVYYSAWSYEPDPIIPNQPRPFTTPSHPLPNADFIYNPVPPSQGEQTWFTNRTTFATGGFEDLTDPWFWEFPGATPATSTDDGYDPDPIEVVFNKFGFQSVTLTARDGALEEMGAINYPEYDGACTVRMRDGLRIQPPLPEFQEVTPTSLFDKVSNIFAFLR